MLSLFWMMLVFLTDPHQAVKATLGDFHDAAAKADRTRYFAHLTDDAVFLGTDGSERWDKAAFEAKYGPYMDSGKGWTFVPTQQNISFSPEGTVAWFDEALSSNTYGPCRGSGVLVLTQGVWRIAQYNLSIPIPNPLAKPFVAIIATQADQPAH